VAYRSHDQLLLAADSKFGVFSPKTHAGGRKIKQSNDVFFASSGLVQDAQTKFYVDQIARTALRPPGAMVKRANRLETEIVGPFLKALQRIKKAAPLGVSAGSAKAARTIAGGLHWF